MIAGTTIENLLDKDFFVGVCELIQEKTMGEKLSNIWGNSIQKL